jgi:hypothetical protein|tara:strand:+ start:10410 stop:10739 length:330 start_codon:yes stop_codon:yes gene_type:complete
MKTSTTVKYAIYDANDNGRAIGGAIGFSQITPTGDRFADSRAAILEFTDKDVNWKTSLLITDESIASKIERLEAELELWNTGRDLDTTPTSGVLPDDSLEVEMLIEMGR